VTVPPGIAVLGRPVDLGRRRQPASTATSSAGRPRRRSPEFGGYFMFTRDGVPVAGAMGDMGDMKANDTWKIYLDTDDIAKTVEAAEARGRRSWRPAMPVADLGTQAVLIDPTGAHLGRLAARDLPRFHRPGRARRAELVRAAHPGLRRRVDFYRTVFHWDTEPVGDSDEFRYSPCEEPRRRGRAGRDHGCRAFLPEGMPAHWSVYWEVDDPAATIATVITKLGGSVVAALEDTPYGRLATVTDPAGAQFKLRARSSGAAEAERTAHHRTRWHDGSTSGPLTFASVGRPA
jgi:predicted enzyme related to lactoylglutathione lyase